MQGAHTALNAPPKQRRAAIRRQRHFQPLSTNSNTGRNRGGGRGGGAGLARVRGHNGVVLKGSVGFPWGVGGRVRGNHRGDVGLGVWRIFLLLLQEEGCGEAAADEGNEQQQQEPPQAGVTAVVVILGHSELQVAVGARNAGADAGDSAGIVCRAAVNGQAAGILAVEVAVAVAIAGRVPRKWRCPGSASSYPDLDVGAGDEDEVSIVQKKGLRGRRPLDILEDQVPSIPDCEDADGRGIS